MSASVFDLFTIGIGPSSSHTVGPMRAARQFGEMLRARGLFSTTVRVRAELFGSLGHTGKGHGSDRAVVLGLEGERPERVDPDAIPGVVERVATESRLRLLGEHDVEFDLRGDLVFHRKKVLPKHPNGMRFAALDAEGNELRACELYSVGGGFVISDDVDVEEPMILHHTELPHPFSSGAELLDRCEDAGISIGTLMLANEQSWRTRSEIHTGLLEIASVMTQCIDHGCRCEGLLPGGLKVKRRACALHRRLKNNTHDERDPLVAMDWVNLWALAVSEENAAGGRVVTAPTNGAAGIIPPVLRYYTHYGGGGGDDDSVVRFLLAAGAIGMLYRANASISGAEVGCQGEVGVACSMAAAGLAEVMGGTPAQVENAAEIGMEHNLGLTCDPVGGLVQVPCIERNAMGAVKAINAARLALQGDGAHKISLDKVIATMRQTGMDMKTKYKETARGGLAVNIIEC